MNCYPTRRAAGPRTGYTPTCPRCGRVLRRTGGPADHLIRSGPRYRLNHDVLDVDLWRMRDALREAEHADEPEVRVAALHRAVGCYRGELAVVAVGMSG